MRKKTKAKKALTREQKARNKLDDLFDNYDSTLGRISKNSVKNIVQCLDYFQSGRVKSDSLKRCGELLLVEKLKNFSEFLLNAEAFNFDRITALKFHPTASHIYGVGCRSGTVSVRLLNTYYRDDGMTWGGIGPRESITDLSFDPFTPHSIFTTSIDGTVMLRNYITKTCRRLLCTGSNKTWYCSITASAPLGLVLASDSNGNVKLLNKDLREVQSYGLHKKKVNCIDFSKKCAWLVATASADKTAKIWDIRMLKPNYLISTLHHVDSVNSAYFSQTNGNRLLTTDFYNELRVYRGPNFDFECKIPHPHRPFSQLTPIRATWHPLCDIIVVGRYPDPKWPTYHCDELNTIDIISCETGSIEAQLSSSAAPGIVSLNSFNCTGEILASAIGAFTLCRKHKHPEQDTPRRCSATILKVENHFKA